jgi:hypothetical protein
MLIKVGRSIQKNKMLKIHLNYVHPDTQYWCVSANLKPYMKIIGPGIACGFIYENGSLVDT